MIREFKQMAAELSEKPTYWKLFEKYRSKKDELKNKIQSEFKAWRKQLRVLEMKILD